MTHGADAMAHAVAVTDEQVEVCPSSMPMHAGHSGERGKVWEPVSRQVQREQLVRGPAAGLRNAYHPVGTRASR
jgi:hypothetical protein